jgi:hypothetical protein
MPFTEFKGLTNYGENLVDDHLRANLISFFDWGFIQTGAFHNITIPSSGNYGGNKHQLQLVKDPRYTNGQVWQANRGNWVWQSGTNYSAIQVSGVEVNGSFCPLSGVGPYSHYVDYPNGRIIFNTAISQTATVKAQYSTKLVNVVDANQFKFTRQIQEGSININDSNFSNPSSGNWAINPENRIQLPAVAIEVTNDRNLSPLMIGGGQYFRNKVIFHVLAESEKEASHIATIITMQNEKTNETFNVNSISQNNLSPLNYRGSIASGALTHPQMTAAYPYRKITMYDFGAPTGQWLNSVYYVPVQCRTEVQLPNI